MAALFLFRTLSFLFFSFCPTGKQMWTSVAKRRKGVEYFADPLGKASLTTYWRTLAELAFSSVFTLSKKPTEEGFAAASNSPMPAWEDDGVTVSDS